MGVIIQISLRVEGGREYLEDVLGSKVDLVTPGALRPQFKERIPREVAYV
jgi:predicted nucleotidyltransferase